MHVTMCQKSENFVFFAFSGPHCRNLSSSLGVKSLPISSISPLLSLKATIFHHGTVSYISASCLHHVHFVTPFGCDSDTLDEKISHPLNRHHLASLEAHNMASVSMTCECDSNDQKGGIREVKTKRGHLQFVSTIRHFRPID